MKSPIIITNALESLTILIIPKDDFLIQNHPMPKFGT